MQVLHVNRAEPRTVRINGKEALTGIYKEPVTGPVLVHKLGLEGDGQADLTVHGGPFQAVYAYPAEHYAYWENELESAPFPPGTFGENLTLEGLLETDTSVSASWDSAGKSAWIGMFSWSDLLMILKGTRSPRGT